jgi:uncharacterized membrane protein YraQ (UPF0718 family)
MKNFSIIFISIVLEAMPFIFLGSFISALIEVLVSEKLIAKFIPKNKIVAFLGAGFIGMLFPVCECAIVPITQKLIKKGVPNGIATTFMLATPIVNPIVLLSTYYAFYDKPSMIAIRGIFGFLAAVFIGIFIDITQKNKTIVRTTTFDTYGNCSCGCDIGYYTTSRLIGIIEHMRREFINILKYLMIGALISATFQSLIPIRYLVAIGGDSLYSIIIMMILAFVLSICSEADAFVAKTFLGQFTVGSVTAFLILGPMVDIKNVVMLSSAFKKKFVVELVIYIVLVTLFVGYVVNVLSGLGIV